jgi:NAD(P)-dependent dehydrogenase (short-subunit alcohol dehydrogenase family)
LTPTVTGIGQQGDPEMWGNGAATARVFAQQGAEVIGCDLNLESAQYTQKKIASEGHQVAVHKCDVTKDSEVKTLVDQVMSMHGRIDVLVKSVLLTTIFLY